MIFPKGFQSLVVIPPGVPANKTKKPIYALRVVVDNESINVYADSPEEALQTLKMGATAMKKAGQV